MAHIPPKKLMLIGVGSLIVLVALFFIYIGSFIIQQMPSRHPVSAAASNNDPPATLSASHAPTVQPLTTSASSKPTADTTAKSTDTTSSTSKKKKKPVRNQSDEATVDESDDTVLGNLLRRLGL